MRTSALKKVTLITVNSNLNETTDRYKCTKEMKNMIGKRYSIKDCDGVSVYLKDEYGGYWTFYSGDLTPVPPYYDITSEEFCLKNKPVLFNPEKL